MTMTMTGVEGEEDDEWREVNAKVYEGAVGNWNLPFSVAIISCENYVYIY